MVRVNRTASGRAALRALYDHLFGYNIGRRSDEQRKATCCNRYSIKLWARKEGICLHRYHERCIQHQRLSGFFPSRFKRERSHEWFHSSMKLLNSSLPYVCASFSNHLHDSKTITHPSRYPANDLIMCPSLSTSSSGKMRDENDLGVSKYERLGVS